MCLGVPGKIVEIVDEAHDIAKVDVSGVRRNVNIALVREEGAEVGSWVLIHVGFALSMINEREAEETLNYLKMMEAEFAGEMEQFAQSQIE
ncbi:MAG: HypC/HybG/HupF family hydrogenase formation chaperone [Armatimonadetes bacterium]|nr:HypC/HybG/HupF family hydrogenase formation chaperone [Armatimonadota bacterium]